MIKITEFKLIEKSLSTLVCDVTTVRIQSTRHCNDSFGKKKHAKCPQPLTLTNTIPSVNYDIEKRISHSLSALHLESINQ